MSEQRSGERERERERVLVDGGCRKIMMPLVRLCACVSTQGPGGLYQCDHPATHDGEYNEALMTPLPSNSNTRLS